MNLEFRKVLIADERYESCAVFDVNNDGIPDIVSGEWWYEGPDFRRRYPVGKIKPFNEYFDDFATVPLDVDGDGFTDFITGGWFGDSLRWRRNPGDPEKEWPESVICESSNIESIRAWDIDGDGVVEIIPNTPNAGLVIFKLETDANGKGTGKFCTHKIREEKQGHGLGAGDIAGNGRVDIVLNSGWLEALDKPMEEPWTWHPEFQLFKEASVPILVADVNRDGLNDLIVGCSHEYGLDWWEQRIEGGERLWIRHPIDPFNSQYHDMKWIDIDGDGEGELVTGKRYRAHNGRDAGAFDDYGIYYFKWTGEALAKQVICFGQMRETTGLGIFFDMHDLTGNGYPDIIAPGKDGLYIFYNEGPK